MWDISRYWFAALIATHASRDMCINLDSSMNAVNLIKQEKIHEVKQIKRGRKNIYLFTSIISSLQVKAFAPPFPHYSCAKPPIAQPVSIISMNLWERLASCVTLARSWFGEPKKPEIFCGSIHADSYSPHLLRSIVLLFFWSLQPALELFHLLFQKTFAFAHLWDFVLDLRQAG